jgi:Protein of unknown function (DUF3223)
MAKYTLGDHEFGRKGDAVTYVREILRGATLGDRIDDPIMYALLDQHPRREEKVERGVAGIEVTPNDWGDRCFAVRTDDGDLIAFSFLECFKPSTPTQDAKAALRVEIADQITDFRRATDLVCAVSGIALTYTKGRPDTAEVDHAPPATFDALAEQWAQTQGGWTCVVNHQEGQRRRLTLDEQRSSWRLFHAEHARLRMLSARAHRNVGS